MVKSVGGPRRSRRTAPPSGRAADLVALAVIAVTAIGLAGAALTGVHLHPAPVSPSRIAPPSAVPTPESTTTPTPTPTSASVVAVSLLHDGTVTGNGSWWSLSVGANAVPNVVDGAEAPLSNTEATANSTVEELGSLLEASPSLQGYIVVEAGAVDLADGRQPVAVAESVAALWQVVRDRGGVPIATLLPPSGDEAAEIVALNAALASAAQGAGIGVLDLHSAVSTPAGLWNAGLSDDGDVANAEGSAALAAASVAQLPALLAPR